MEGIPPLAFLLVILTAPLAYNAPTDKKSSSSSETYVQELLKLSQNCSFPSEKIFNEPDASWSDKVNNLCSDSSAPSKLCGVLTGAVHVICKKSRQEIKVPTTRQEILLKVKDDVEDASKFCKRLDRPVPAGVVGVNASLLKSFTAGQKNGSECVKFCWKENKTPDDFKVESLCVLTLTALDLLDANGDKAEANDSADLNAKSVDANAKNADVSAKNADANANANNADANANNADTKANNADINANSADTSGVSSNTLKGTETKKAKKGEQNVGQNVGQNTGSETDDNPLPAVIAAGSRGGSASEDEDNEGTVNGQASKVTPLIEKGQPKTSPDLAEGEEDEDVEGTPKSPNLVASLAQAGTGDTDNTLRETPDKRMPTDSVKLQSVSQTSETSAGSESKLPSSSSNPTSSLISSNSPSNPIPLVGEISTGKAILSSQTVSQSGGQIPPGSTQEKTGPIEEKTGPVEEKTGPVEEKTGPVEEKTGPAEAKTEPVEEKSESAEEKSEPADELKSSSASSTSSKKPAEELESNPNKFDEGSDVLQKPMESSNQKTGVKEQNAEDSDMSKFSNQKLPQGSNPDSDGDDDIDGLDEISNGGSDVSEMDQQQRPGPISQSTGRNVMPQPPSFNNVISGAPYENDSDSGFMRHAMVFLVISGVCWILFHNRKRMIAMIVEGRRPKTHRSNANGSRRSSKGTAYRKLENNFD